jgi:hypothetical protein
VTRLVLAVVLAVAGLGACALAALSLAYRRTLVRLLRERHTAVWAELGHPAPLAAPARAGARALAAFLRAGRHYTLNDTDVAAAGRLYAVTARGALLLATVAAAIWILAR